MIIYFLIIIYYFINKYLEQKQFKSIKKVLNNPIILNRKGEINKDRFTVKKIPKNLDAIVIGSGISGLTTAALLSRFGKKVLVLEGHYIAGGCTHSFIDKGFEFDTGVHYVGINNEIIEILNSITNKKIIWDKMGREDKNYVYDRILLNNRYFNFRSDDVNWLKDMCNYFPKEKVFLRKYVKLVKRVASMKVWFIGKMVKSNWLTYMINYWFGGEFFKMAHSNTYKILKNMTKNEELISLLCSQFGNHGLPPRKSSFYTHCCIVKHFFDGGFYPRGGTSEIAKRIIPVIESAGGRVLVSKKVKQIIIENNKAIGIIMENGVKIKSKIVISTAGVNNTYRNLIKPKLNICKELDNIGLSFSLMYLFIGFNKTSKELGFKSYNFWDLPNYNYDETLEKFYKNPESNPMISFINSPSAKDSSWDNRYPSKSTAVVLVPVKYKLFEKWKNNKDKDYYNLKNMFKTKMLEILFKHYPKAKGNVVYTNIGSPLTYNTYINSICGEVYGLKNCKEKFKLKDKLKIYTNIKNLYLSGQDVLSPGFTGGLISGYLTANICLGYNIIKLAMGKSCVKDINNCLKNYKN